MKKMLLVILMYTLATSCHVNKQNFQPMADSIKQYFMNEIPDIKSVDTIYLLIREMSLRDVVFLQSVEYNWASTEAKRNGSADSLLLKEKADSVMNRCFYFDSTGFVYYDAAPTVIFTRQDLTRGIADNRMFFDKNLRPVAKYSFIQKIAKTDNLGIRIQPFVPFTPAEYEMLAKNKILKYY